MLFGIKFNIPSTCMFPCYMHRWETGRSLWLCSTWFCQYYGRKYADVFSCNTKNLQYPFCAVILSFFPLYTTYYGKMPLIQHHIIQRFWWFGSWEESSLRTRCFAFYQQKFHHQWTDRSEGHVQKSFQECLYIKHSGICWLLVSYTISFFSWWRRYRNGILLWLLVQSNYRNMKKTMYWRTLFSIITAW